MKSRKLHFTLTSTNACFVCFKLGQHNNVNIEQPILMKQQPCVSDVDRDVYAICVSAV